MGETTRNANKIVPLGKIFLAALAIRWAYDLILFAAMGEGGLTGPDSRFFLTLGHRMVDGAHSGAIHGWALLGLEPHIMPLVTWAFAACVLLFGKMAPLGYIMLQGIIDACTCVVVCAMAELIAPRFAVPAGIAAAINPTQIVLSGIVYTDTPFVFLCALSLLASMKWLRSPSWGSSWLIGLSIGTAAMIRVLIVPWAAFLGFFLLAAQAIRGGLSIRHLGQVMLIGAITGVIVSPVLTRNVTQFGAWALTPQTGAYVAYWLVPLVREFEDWRGLVARRRRYAKACPRSLWRAAIQSVPISPTIVRDRIGGSDGAWAGGDRQSLDVWSSNQSRRACDHHLAADFFAAANGILRYARRLAHCQDNEFCFSVRKLDLPVCIARGCVWRCHRPTHSDCWTCLLA